MRLSPISRICQWPKHWATLCG